MGAVDKVGGIALGGAIVMEIWKYGSMVKGKSDKGNYYGIDDYRDANLKMINAKYF